MFFQAENVPVSPYVWLVCSQTEESLALFVYHIHGVHLLAKGK